MKRLEDRILGFMEHGASQRVISGVLNAGLKNSVTRKALIKALERGILKMSLKQMDRPEKVLMERYYMARAFLGSLDRVYASGSISPGCAKALTEILLGKVFVEGMHVRRTFEKTHGFRPPCFVTISPTNVCNLKCKGCYAGEPYTHHVLPYRLFSDVVRDIKEKIGSHFVVISGGEPLLYRDGEKTLYDLLEEHRDVYFMAYTNGTLIRKDLARKLSHLGNFSPAISVEGFHEETDFRRGDGVHARILEAMESLREAGVPFGISVTPTRHNCDILLSDEFVDFYFTRQAAFYGWYFQYMPIGRSPSMDLMVTPEQRLAMLRRIWELVTKRNFFIADFWNSGTASDGCMAAARGGGYFYVMWDGTVTPCVFIPFKDREHGDLHRLYAEGKTVVDAIKAPLFSRIRDWQNDYWVNQPKERCGNLLTPCVIRDNSLDFSRIVRETGAVAVDEGAQTFLSLVESGQMPRYNREYRALTDPIWEREYLNERA